MYIFNFSILAVDVLLYTKNLLTSSIFAKPIDYHSIRLCRPLIFYVCYVIGLYVYIYLHIYIYISTLPPRHCPVQNFFFQTRVASERFYWPGGNRFTFQMSWSQKRRDSETLATAWTLRLSTCMASKHKKHTHTTHTDLLLSWHTRFH